MLTALVAGSSGYVGSRLIPALERAGHRVVATARDAGSLDRFDFPDTVQRVDLDANDAESCRAAFAAAGQVDVAYYLIHSIGGDDFADRDQDAAQTFIDAAARAGVTRVVYLGGFVPQGEELSEHLDSRADVGDALDETSVDLVWLRAAVILGAGSTSYELVRYLAERLPVLPLPIWMRHPVAPIAVDDVLRYLVASADTARVPAGHYDIFNGETMTYADLIKTYAAANGRRRWWVRLRGISPGFAAPVVSRLTPIPQALVADLVESLANTMSSQDTSIREHVPDPEGGLTTLAEAIDRACIEPGFVPHGVYATTDPLRLTDSDPDWAGGDEFRETHGKSA